MIKRFYIFGNIGKLTELPKSGGQTSARRVIDGLRQSGFEVFPIVRHRAELEGKFAHLVEVLTFAWIDLFKIIGNVMFQKRSQTAFFHLTFSGTLVPYELIISYVLKVLGIRRIMYLQGGQFMDAYTQGSPFMRWMFKKNVDLQEIVFFEGLEGMELVRGITTTRCIYFPGYAFEKDIVKVVPVKNIETINLCYFGRIGPMKNVHIVVEIFNMLCKKGVNAHLTIIGGAGQSKDYVTKVDHLIKTSPYYAQISRYGLSPFSFIKETLRTQHFYIFPTHERCEGHSNALTECMSQGVIPIVSDYHFNKSVVGNDLLVVDGYNPKDYADRIAHIIENYDMQKLATEMRQRVVDHFSYEVVNTRICNELRSL